MEGVVGEGVNGCEGVSGKVASSNGHTAIFHPHRGGEGGGNG